MRPTARAVALFAAGVPFALAVVLADDGLWTLGFGHLAFAIALTGFDAFRALPPRALDIAVTVPARLFVGEEARIAVTLRAADRCPATTVEIACDSDPELAVARPDPVALVPGRPADISIPLRALRRGSARVHRLWVRWPGPLGLTMRRTIRPLDAPVAMLADVRAVHRGRGSLRFDTRDALFGFKPQSQHGDGSEFEALRDYRPGLDHRSIDWKHSARHGAPVCKEFRAERNHQVILAFDTGHLMSEPLDGISRLDHAVNSGLALAWLSLGSGDQVGLFGFDARVRLAMAPVRGTRHFIRILDASARLDYHHEETNFTLGLTELLGRLRRRSLVILQTEFVDTVTAELMVTSIERLAARHLVVFVTVQDARLAAAVDVRPNSVADVSRAVIAGNLHRERRIVLERLRRLGVHCLDVPRERVGADLVNRYLTIRKRELI